MRKLRSNSGLTLVELLVTLIILMLVGVSISIGITTAVHVYRQSLFASESEILENTLNTTLSDYLRYASYADGQIVSTYEPGTGGLVTAASDDLSERADKGYICYGVDGDYRLILNTGAYANLVVSGLSWAYDSGIFSGSYTIQSSDGAITKACTFSYRTTAV